MPDLLTTRESADRLRCTPETIRAMIARGELIARKAARGYLIEAAELARWLAARTAAPREVAR